MDSTKITGNKTPSTNFIVILFVFAFLLVFLSWIFTQNLRHIPDNETIDLSTSSDKLLISWYNSELHNCIDKFRVDDDDDIASLFLERNYNVTHNKNKLVIGNNIGEAVKLFTDQSLTENKIKIYDIRSMVGIDGEIAYVPSKSIRKKLQRYFLRENIHVDLDFLHKIMANNLDITARKFLYNKLNDRWNTIRSLHNSHVINNKGSYLYMFNTDIINVTGTIDHDSDKGRVTKYNLLCSDLEFKYFIERLTKSSQIQVRI